MPINRKWMTGLAAGAVGIAIVAVAASAASASPGQPAPSDDRADLVTVDQADIVWRSAVAGFPAALPDGVVFPQAAPAFFHPEKEDPREQHLFQEGLVEAFVASYWRCTWLEQHVGATDRGDTAGVLQAEEALTGYATVPGNYAAEAGFQGYLAALDEQAGNLGTTPQALELSNDCGLIVENGASA